MCSMYENIDDGAFVGRKKYYVLMLRLTSLGWDYYLFITSTLLHLGEDINLLVVSDCTNISFLSFTLSLSSQISVVEFINKSFNLSDRPTFKMNIYHILGHFIVLDLLL